MPEVLYAESICNPVFERHKGSKRSNRNGRRYMAEVIAFIALAIWVAVTEIRIHRLYFRNDFLTERVADVDARMCIMEENAEGNEVTE